MMTRPKSDCWAMAWLGVLAAALAARGQAPTGPIADGLDQGLSPAWSALWTRDANTGKVVVDDQIFHQAKPSLRIEHTGANDWSLNRTERLAVEPGDLYEITAYLKVQGEGSATLCAAAYDKTGKAVDWSLGGRTVRQAADWQLARCRLVVPQGVTHIIPRLIGNGPATVWFDDFALKQEGNLRAMGGKDLPEKLTVENAAIAVTFHPADATLSVLDKRTGKTWSQKPASSEYAVRAVKADAAAGSITATLLAVGHGLDVQATFQLDRALPEFTATLDAKGDLSRALAYPHPFVSDAGSYLVVPMNEGISYPVDDASIGPMRLVAYGGHGICMAFFGVAEAAGAGPAQMAILETPDDASIRIARMDGKLCIAPEWDAQRGQFGYPRKLRYAFFDRGGHVAIAKRYRAYAQKTGLLKTLADKRKQNPNVDLLIGAVNVWCWDREAPPIVKEMQAAGIQRILWSNAQSPENLKILNDLPGAGVLTSRYDIYQDVMDPAQFPNLRGTHGDWPTEAWPKDLMIGSNGQWARGWQVTAKDGKTMIPCGVVCDKQAVAYAQKRIPAELVTRPYRSRFIDTTTASPWRECYSPDHPMTRSDSRKWKMELLRYVSQDGKLVTGCETGHDASVPYLHFFEGMLSLGPYRVPDSGRKMQEILTDVPERVAKFQVGQQYRLPLWELVYHDCVVAQWYWGDYNNKLPAIWDKRDLFNALYGTPPMFMFNRQLWQQNKDRFVQSYKATCPIARATGYSEMTDHRFLSPDRNVQQTSFANGVTVTVNFGDKPFALPDGAEVKALGMVVKGLN